MDKLITYRPIRLFILMFLGCFIFYHLPVVADTLYAPYRPLQHGQLFEVWTYNLDEFPKASAKIKLPIIAKDKGDEFNEITHITADEYGNAIGLVVEGRLTEYNPVLFGFNRFNPATLKTFELVYKEGSYIRSFSSIYSLKLYRNQLYAVNVPDSRLESNSVWVFDNPMQDNSSHVSQQRYIAKDNYKLSLPPDCPAGNYMITAIDFDKDNNLYASWFDYDGTLEHCVGKYPIGKMQAIATYHVPANNVIFNLAVDDSGQQPKLYAQAVKFRKGMKLGKSLVKFFRENLDIETEILELVPNNYPILIHLNGLEKSFSLNFDEKRNTYCALFDAPDKDILKYPGIVPEGVDPVGYIPKVASKELEHCIALAR